MLRLIAKIFANGLAVLITAWLLPGVSLIDYITAILVAVVLVLLNIFIKPLLVLLTIPFTIITFGLFLFVINALIILLADNLIGGFEVDGFWWALLFSIILSVVNSIFESIDRNMNNKINT